MYLRSQLGGSVWAAAARGPISAAASRKVEIERRFTGGPPGRCTYYNASKVITRRTASGSLGDGLVLAGAGAAAGYFGGTRVGASARVSAHWTRAAFRPLPFFFPNSRRMSLMMAISRR